MTDLTSTATDRDVSLKVGDVVEYRGSIESSHGTYVVVGRSPNPAVHYAAFAEGIDHNTIPEAWRYTIRGGEDSGAGKATVGNVRRQSLALVLGSRPEQMP